jgi:AcrR family transcriptional regulator
LTESRVPPLGRRESAKEATRRSLQDAATTLFEERGYAGTTVRDIAEVAGVTERTFFRYFGSKEELLAERVLAAVPIIEAEICGRPVAEPPMVAVHRALTELIGVMRARTTGPTVTDFFAQGPPVLRMRRPSAGLLLKFEAGIARALLRRLTEAGTASPQSDLEYQAEVLAAAAMAVVRTALIRDSRLTAEGVEERPDLTRLLDDGFAVLHAIRGQRSPSHT